MNIVMAQERSDALMTVLLSIWEMSVRATHHFLTPDDIVELKPFVESALQEIPVLLYGVCGDEPCGFMGIDGDRVEMLFLHPDHRSKGRGRTFMEFAVQRGVTYVDVNEDNGDARAFYERMGFVVFQRSALDGQGKPFPILHMTLE